MEKEFVPYQQALELKELGFDEECFGQYSQIGHNFSQLVTSNEELDTMLNSIYECDAPTFSQAFRWFREKYGLDFGIDKIYNGTDNYHYHINLEWQYFEGNYEEAELACLIKLIEILTKSNNEIHKR
jgi:hypothetical protein